MKINLQNAAFLKSGASRSDFIRDDTFKIAFCGRSNVGKSSTINAILNRRKLARTSDKPGKTAYVNYYAVDGKLWIIDLPGYGYARVSHDEKRRWATLMDNFFSSGEHTDLSVLIVDARRAPTEDDRVMCEYLKQMDMPYLVIMNKADKLKKREIDDAKARVSDTLDLSDEVTVFPFSAVKREGVDLLWDELLSYSADALTIR